MPSRSSTEQSSPNLGWYFEKNCDKSGGGLSRASSLSSRKSRTILFRTRQRISRWQAPTIGFHVFSSTYPTAEGGTEGTPSPEIDVSYSAWPAARSMICDVLANT